MEPLDIRESVASDRASIEALYPAAFPDEDLLPLVRDLLQEPSLVVSLVGIAEGAVAGHILFTACAVTGCAEGVWLLAPLAVAPAWQRRGVGSALVRAGLTALGRDGATTVYTWGDPAYYGRFGFVQETGVEPPYPLPREWLFGWQSVALGPAKSPRTGMLTVPRPWLRPELWAPPGADGASPTTTP